MSTLQKQLDILSLHVCCHEEEEVAELLAKLRDAAMAEGKRQGWNAAADHLASNAQTLRDQNPYPYVEVPR